MLFPKYCYHAKAPKNAKKGAKKANSWLSNIMYIPCLSINWKIFCTNVPWRVNYMLSVNYIMVILKVKTCGINRMCCPVWLFWTALNVQCTLNHAWKLFHILTDLKITKALFKWWMKWMLSHYGDIGAGHRSGNL